MNIIKPTLPLLLAAVYAQPALSYDLNDVQRAATSPPATKTYSTGQNVLEYDLKIENLCDTPQSLNTIATGWVGPKRTGNIFEDGFNVQDRSVALAAVVTFPNAKIDEIKQVKVPIITKTNFGDATVQNCEGTVVKNVPANARINLHFEFRRSATVRFNDPTKLVDGITKVGSSALALGAAASGVPTFGATIVPVVSFLEKNTNAITTLNTGVNEIMESFADAKAPDPKQYEIKSTATSIVYRSGRTPIITISKSTKDTGVDAVGDNGWLGVSSAFAARYGSLQTQFNNAQSSVDSPWSANLPKFCGKLRNYIDLVTNGDRYASALGIGYHAFYYSAEYNGKTCLNNTDIAALQAHRFAPPFPGAWPTNATPSQPVVAKSAPDKKTGKSARLANAYFVN